MDEQRMERIVVALCEYLLQDSKELSFAVPTEVVDRSVDGPYQIFLKIEEAKDRWEEDVTITRVPRGSVPVEPPLPPPLPDDLDALEESIEVAE